MEKPAAEQKALKEQKDVLSLVAIRNFWAWPLGLTLIGIIELIIQTHRQGFHGLSFVLALLIALSSGLWVGVLFSLLSRTFVGRALKNFLSRDYVLQFSKQAVASMGVGALFVGAVYGLLFFAYPFALTLKFDFPEDALRIWQGLLLIAAFPLLLVAVLIFSRTFKLFKERPWLAKLSYFAFILTVLTHFAKGQFVIFMGPIFVFSLWPLSALLWTLVLPYQISVKPAYARLIRLLPAVLLLSGLAAMQHVGARSLLLHNSMFFAPMQRIILTVFDFDRDDDLPIWLGGGDCDNWNAEVGQNHVELPGNGIDDNCYGGDAPAQEHLYKDAKIEKHLPIFFITLDAVRADHLDLYGYHRETMPGLRKKAVSARWFRLAQSPANATLYSMPVFFTGQSCESMLVTPQKGMMTELRYAFWLPSFLRQQGYQTIALRPPSWVIAEADSRNLGFELTHQGFFDHLENGRGTTSKQLVDQAFSIIDERDRERTLFMWIQFEDAHAPHKSYPIFSGQGSENAYDGELHWIDKQLTRLIDHIENTFSGQAIIVVTADHGEQFDSFGAYGHGYTLHSEETHVPLLIWGPGVRPGPVNDPVSLVGITPTLLDLLGAPQHPGLSYPSLMSASLPTPFTEVPMTLWNEPYLAVSILQGHYKYIWKRSLNTMELYDLQKDPNERNNLVAVEPELRKKLQLRVHKGLEALH